MSGGVGVQRPSFQGTLSSGGSFYYHATLVASGATPSVGPERGGTRVRVLVLHTHYTTAARDFACLFH